MHVFFEISNMPRPNLFIDTSGPPRLSHEPTHSPRLHSTPRPSPCVPSIQLPILNRTMLPELSSPPSSPKTPSATLSILQMSPHRLKRPVSNSPITEFAPSSPRFSPKDPSLRKRPNASVYDNTQYKGNSKEPPFSPKLTHLITPSSELSNFSWIASLRDNRAPPSGNCITTLK
ncbi:hypothetical protein RCL1_005996 [Eukaryota sp. TZLM3-RCL]